MYNICIADIYNLYNMYIYIYTYIYIYIYIKRLIGLKNKITRVHYSEFHAFDNRQLCIYLTYLFLTSPGKLCDKLVRRFHTIGLEN